MKKVWLASITLLFTISVLIISSQAAYAGGPPPEFALKCYLGSGNPPVQPGPVTVVDQFINDIVDPDVDQRYCVEALKHSDTAPINPRYWVEHEDEAGPNTIFPGVTIQDQFSGTFTTSLSHFDLLVPANVTGLVAGPLNNQQHYSGYSPNVILPGSTLVTVTDQFGTSIINITNQNIFAFEATAIKDGKGTLTGQDLTCYMFGDDDEVPRIDPNSTASQSFWGTQFLTNTSIKDLDPADVLCVKANKITTPPSTPSVGGELFPIDSTALLLAGVQTNLAWIIPAVVIASGIGVFLFRRK